MAIIDSDQSSAGERLKAINSLGRLLPEMEALARDRVKLEALSLIHI